jgi:hypothetical protein
MVLREEGEFFVSGVLHRKLAEALAAPKNAPEKLHLSVTYYLKSSSDELLVPESRRYYPDAPMDFAGLAELSV